ncbi:hypothetical protein QBC47DRAFT_389118 [Echria macrotheca]|uniref:Structure-specific endonuclease subunit SLX4 n=1 Tax=Echria macrotheca TaxID=438768 RepID=A0AAJ0B7L0_9PEZI|nr:hypothetical protein QBC47DRAFT_389118 [Echria macrotheca]
MATTGLMPSSPARMAHDYSVFVISSSPEFPSIDELVKKPKKPALRSGSNAAPIPDNALTSFTTATSVWRSTLAEANADGDLAMQDALDAKLALATTPCDAVAELPPTKPPPKVKRVPKAQKAPRAAKQKTSGEEVTEADGSLVTGPVSVDDTAKPARKRRSTKTAHDGQTTLPKGKVTKAVAKEKVSRKKTETVSRHFAANVAATESVCAPAKAPAPEPVSNEPLHLEPAMRRRMSWTPPPDDVPVSIISNHVDIGDLSSPHANATNHSGDNLFKNLLDNFGCGEKSSEALPGQASMDVLGKRKLIQLVKTNTTEGSAQDKSPETSPAKTKAPKKKPRTITDLATAAYRVPDESEIESAVEGAKKQSLMSYLTVEGGEHASDGSGAAGKGKVSKKPAKLKTTKKKEDPRQQVLLSPTSAIGQVTRQDFVFGTASQLATEDDPDLLRALHEAMKLSNQMDDPFCSSPISTSLPRRAAKRLWGAGNRDECGDLLDLEVLDLTESPPVKDHDVCLPTLKGKEAERTSVGAHQSQRIAIEIVSSDFDPFDSVEPPSKLHFFPTQISGGQKGRISVISSPKAQPPADADEAVSEPPPSNQEHNQLLEQSQTASSPKAKAPEGPVRPNYELLTDAQLSKSLCKYGFKFIKKRTAMIALLNQCWDSKNMPAPAIRSVQASVSMSTSAPVQVAAGPSSPSPKRKGRPKKDAAANANADADKPVKRGRGRPKKNASAATASSSTKTKAKAAPKTAAAPKPAVAPEPADLPVVSTPKRKQAPTRAIEIADSDTDMDPFLSSPTSSPEKEQEPFSPSQVGDVSLTEDTEMSLLVASPTTQQKVLFDYVTKAVMTAPRTKDPTNPSWHEKMLMYDPVVLEDLTAWLNGGQLDRVGYDGEIAPAEVKKWCESKSVCCIWRVNLHGRERKRV